jgi:hypothetical protein
LLVLYSTRENFAPAAIASVAKAFLDTCEFLQREGAYENDGVPTLGAAESSEVEPLPEPRIMAPTSMQSAETTKTAIVAALLEVGTIPHAEKNPFEDLAMNDVQVTLKGRLAHVQVLLDNVGFSILEKKIRRVKSMMGLDPTLN